MLDFGLARAVGAAGSGSDVADAPTTAADATIDGALLGTAAYMSPEQARGRPVDTRTDIWAFGCVVYEMLTGAKAFGGDGLAEVLANVIKGEPDWTALPAETPPALRLCLRRCLQKDARQRFHHIADVRLAMEDAFEATPGGSDSAHTSRRSCDARRVRGLGGHGARGDRRDRHRRRRRPERHRHTRERRAVRNATGPLFTQDRRRWNRHGGDDSRGHRRGGPGGTVTLLPGTYAEAVTIKKGLTLQATGERSGTVILAPSGSPESVVEIADDGARDPARPHRSRARRERHSRHRRRESHRGAVYRARRESAERAGAA